MRTAEYLRFYDSTLWSLAERGHDVLVALNRDSRTKQVDPARFAALHRSITFAGFVPLDKTFRWRRRQKTVRGLVDFLRYLHPDYRNAPALRARMQRRGLPRSLGFLARIPSLPPWLLKVILHGLFAVDRLTPLCPAVLEFVARQEADCVAVTPMVTCASEQVDIVKAARKLRVPTAVCVASWDNLTNKGLLRVKPDRVMVWNDWQRRELQRYHYIPSDRVDMTGAQNFDHWFGRVPDEDRRAFLDKIGLPGGGDYLLYVCSSSFIAGADSEMVFVRRWLAALHCSQHARLRSINVLVRPHPYDVEAWRHALFTDLGNVAIWPVGPRDPTDAEEQRGYFHSLYHATAVVGINTSAMIEAAIIGRAVFAVGDDDFSDKQQGTLHFQYLLRENGGFLNVALSLDEHVEQLNSVVANEEHAGHKRFLRDFLRPHGLDQCAAPFLADALVRLADCRKKPR